MWTNILEEHNISIFKATNQCASGGSALFNRSSDRLKGIPFSAIFSFRNM
jgi:hypothetical protein